MIGSADHRELGPLIAAMLQGDLHGDGVRRLESLLSHSSEARRVYRSHVNLHAALRRYALAAAPRPHSAVRGWVRRAIPFAVAAALVLAVGVVATVVLHSGVTTDRRAAAEPIATLIDVGNAVFEPTDLPTQAGSPLPPGWLKLKKGEAKVGFASGAQVTLQGPCEFGLNSAMRGFLREGTIVAHVPHAARGFTIGARGCAVIDLGTEFRMRALPGGQSEVEVLQGRVAMKADGAAASRVFTEGQASRYDPRTATLEPIPPGVADQPVDRHGYAYLAIAASEAAVESGGPGNGWQITPDPRAGGGAALRSVSESGVTAYEIHFSRPGIYYLYYRARVGSMPAGKHDSFTAPAGFDVPPAIRVDGFGTTGIRRLGGTAARTENFTTDYQWFAQGGTETGPLRYTVTDEQAALRQKLTLRIGAREQGFIVDRWLLSTDPDLFKRSDAATLDRLSDAAFSSPRTPPRPEAIQKEN